MDRREFLHVTASSCAVGMMMQGSSASAQSPAAKPSRWNARFAPNIGLQGIDTPMFKDSVGTLDPVDHVNFIADLGFAGVEDNRLKSRTVRDQERLGQALAKRGLEMGAFMNNLESSRATIFGTFGPDSRDQLMKELLSSVESAKRVNGRFMNTVSQRDSAVPLSYALQAMVENLRHLAPVAEKAGVVMVIEPINTRSGRNPLVSTVADAAFVVRAVNSPAVKILFDCYHVQIMEGDLIANFDRCAELVGLVQIADNPGRAEPGTGEINYANVIRHIKAKGYAGLIEMEHEVSRPGKEGEDAMLRAYETLNAALA